jgi:phosphoribosylamine---glycine ligase
MNILVIGSGGREHALVWKLSKSKKCNKIHISPGNAGTATIGENVILEGFDVIGKYCLDHNIELVIVGPEQPLVDGIVDYFKKESSLSNIKIIGPDSHGARLEGSKEFANDFMRKYNIPTSDFQSFNSDQILDGIAYLESKKPPYVIKVDGLAAGKGVIIENDIDIAKSVLREILVDKKFGEAGSKVVIEDFLKGIELSIFVLTDGKNYVVLPEAKDYKRIGEGDTGLNTGGMGAISPVLFADKAFLDKVDQRIIQPTIKGLQAENIDYKGFLFIGLMNVDGNPFVIEYNCRLGDPETEVVIPRINNDLLELFIATAERRLNEIKIDIDERCASTIMLVSGGYPEQYQKGKRIRNIDELVDVLPFHAGTIFDEKGNIVTNGGRVMALTAMGDNINEALFKSNNAAEIVEFDKKYYRSDIGKDLLKLSF